MWKRLYNGGIYRRESIAWNVKCKQSPKPHRYVIIKVSVHHAGSKERGFLSTPHNAVKTDLPILLCCRSRNGVDLAKNTSRFQDIYILLGIGIARHDLFSIFAVDPTLDGIGCIFKAAYFIKYIVANEILIAWSSNELKMKSVDPLVHQRIHSFFALCNLIFIHAIDVPNHVQIIQSTIMEKISTFVIIRELTV